MSGHPNGFTDMERAIIEYGAFREKRDLAQAETSFRAIQRALRATPSAVSPSNAAAQASPSVAPADSEFGSAAGPASAAPGGRISDRCQNCPWPKDGCIFPKCGQTNAPASSVADTDRAKLVHEQDCPKVWDFYKRYALGSKLCPSCLMCGHAEPDRDRWAVMHGDLPDIYICLKCVNAARSASAPHEPTPDMCFAGGCVEIDHIRATLPDGRPIVGMENAAKVYRAMVKKHIAMCGEAEGATKL